MPSMNVTDEGSRCDWVANVQHLAIGALTFNMSGGFGVRSAVLGASIRRYATDGFNSWFN